MRRGFLLDIQGCEVALVSHNSISGTFSTSVLSVISKPPNEQVSSFDPKEGYGDNGGSSIELTEMSTLIQSLKQGVSSYLSSEYASTATGALDVADTSSFASSGVIWMGSEAIAYTGKSSTQLGTTSVTRETYATKKSTHEELRLIYQHNPFLLGRKVWMYRVDLDNVSSKQLAYVGYIESIVENDGGTFLTLLSGKKLIEDSQAFSTPFASGKVSDVVLSETIAPDERVLYFYMTSKDKGFDTTGTFEQYVQIEDELLSIGQVIYPAVEATVAAIPSLTYQVEINDPSLYPFEVGDLVDFVSAAGSIIEEGVRITGISHKTSTVLLDHTGQTVALAVNDLVRANYKQVLSVSRGLDGTSSKEVESGSEAVEVRKYGTSKSQTLFDLLMVVLFSKDGDLTNGPTGSDGTSYDILPNGWGVGLHEDDVDFSSFQTVEERTSTRSLRIKEPLDVKELIRSFCYATNSAVFWGRDGKLKCRGRADIYPFEDGVHFLTSSNLKSSIPSVRLDTSQIVNLARIQADFNLDGDPFYTEVILNEESVLRYGKMEMPELKDTGLKYASGVSEMTAALESFLSISAFPTPIITVDVIYDEEQAFEPAQLIDLTFTGLFNAEGGRGFSADVFEVMEVSPQIEEGFLSLTMRRRSVTPDTCRINFSGIVSSVATLDVTIKESSQTNLSPSNPSLDNGFVTSEGNGGAEDIDYFKVGDSLQLIDVSDIGAGNTTASAFISSINYGTRTLTLNAVPAWLADGDWIRLDDYATVRTGGVSQRLGFYCWLSDSSSPPVLGTTDDSSRWGA